MTDAQQTNLFELSSAREPTSNGVVARRAFDIVLAMLGLIVFSPIMFLIVICLWLEGGRPIIFSQVRLGRGGRNFVMYKFRKFHPNCDSNGSPLTMENDRRMTRIGKVLQATKLDELPQLWNILVGSMSVVGPRPETPAFRDCFSNGLERVLDHKPGIFGPSQVIFRNESCLYSDKVEPHQFYREYLFPTKARLDLAYYPNRTIISDIAWVMRGTLAVFGIFPAQRQPSP